MAGGDCDCDATQLVGGLDLRLRNYEALIRNLEASKLQIFSGEVDVAGVGLVDSSYKLALN